MKRERKRDSRRPRPWSTHKPQQWPLFSAAIRTKLVSENQLLSSSFLELWSHSCCDNNSYHQSGRYNEMRTFSIGLHVNSSMLESKNASQSARRGWRDQFNCWVVLVSASWNWFLLIQWRRRMESKTIKKGKYLETRRERVQHRLGIRKKLTKTKLKPSKLN